MLKSRAAAGGTCQIRTGYVEDEHASVSWWEHEIHIYNTAVDRVEDLCYRDNVVIVAVVVSF